MSNQIRSFDETVKLFKNIHGDKYEYFSDTYVDSKTKMQIKCNKCGFVFMQTPNKHLLGRGCPKCGKTKKWGLEDFFNAIETKFPVQYKACDETVYINQRTDIVIECLKHGKITVNPKKFLSGCGCELCKNEKLDEFKKSFEERARKIHSDEENLTYEYVEYINNHTPVKIYCHNVDDNGIEHGIFLQTPAHHLRGEGCPKCNGNIKINGDYFVNKAIKIHGDKFTYFPNKYRGYNNYIEIKCNTCGNIFNQTPHNHLKGRGCPECAKAIRGIKRLKTQDEYVNEVSKIHNGKYDYSELKYSGVKDKVYIICHEKDCNGQEHGGFWQNPYAHLSGCGCPKCGRSISKPESEISDYIENTFGFSVERNNRKILENGKEIDIYIPEKKIGFEFDGMIWHSEKYNKDKNYHLDKTNICLNKGIKLFHIYSYEYEKHKELVLSKISDILGKFSNEVINCNVCEIKLINKSDAENFLNVNSLCGFVKSTIFIALCYNNDIVSVMGLKKYSDNWTITIFTNYYKYNVNDAELTLFDYFKHNYKHNKVNAFLDRRWETDIHNNVYIHMGFKFKRTTKPDYMYVNCGGICKDKNEITEETANDLGYYKIWNCGYIKFEYKNPDR